MKEFEVYDSIMTGLIVILIYFTGGIMLKEEELLFYKNDINEDRKLSNINGDIIYVRIKKYKGFINSTSIIRLISDLRYILLHREDRNFKLVLDFDNVQFRDKLVYILCECVCSILIEIYKLHIKVNMKVKRNISTYGLEASCIRYLDRAQDYNAFIKGFHLCLSKTHYRRIVDIKYVAVENYLGKLMEEIAIFLFNIGVDEQASDELSEVVSELVGNAYEHAAGTDCLVDIDVAPYFINNKNNMECYGINVVILNFSQELLGDGIKRKLSNENYIEGRYETVAKAYNKHRVNFDDKYDEDDFYNIMAFQDHISGRIENSEMGGRGLTCLIDSLCEKSEANQCYVMSGNRAVMFDTKYLQYNDGKWLGFNDSNDIFDLPNKNLILRSDTYISGVAYNLNFIINK